MASGILTVASSFRGTRTDGYASSALLGQVSSQTIAEEDGKKSAAAANTPAPDPEDGIDDDQRITKYSLESLYLSLFDSVIVLFSFSLSPFVFSLFGFALRSSPLLLSLQPLTPPLS
jgi:hypothetical protein